VAIGAFALTGILLLPATGVDYQLGGAYPLPNGVGIVARDRSAAPAPGAYNICYVNAFQTQPGSLRWWRAKHPGLVLPVKDAAWGEWLLNTRRPRALAKVVGRWIDGCAAAGFQAVEPDNLDSWTRSDGSLTRADNVRYAKLLIRRAHAAGLAIAQKNAASLAGQRLFDFAVVEECQRYDECATFTHAYGTQVIEIEYRRRDFEAACSTRSIPIVYRDRLLRTPAQKGYRFDRCQST
jgi:hypothetical protein